VAAIAAVVALVAGSFALGVSVSGGGSGTEQQQALAQYLLQPNTQVVRFDATDGGNLAVAYQPGQDQAFVFGAELQPVPEGMQYELWLFPPDGGAPAPGPTFDPPDEGSVVVVPVAADPSESSLMAVTVEQSGGVDQPTSDPVFTAPITA
jgi:anti-sigma-K factor RskA